MGYFSFLFDLHTAACLTGVGLSLYASYVEKRKHEDENYVALCDLGENMQCSRVLTSKYSVGFGFVGKIFGEKSILNQPNCVVGLVFYICQMVVAHFLGTYARLPLLATSIVACIGSVYLAFLLAFVLKDFCVVCVSTYVVNTLIFYSLY